MQSGITGYPLIVPNYPVSTHQTDPQSSLTSSMFGNQQEAPRPGIIAHRFPWVAPQAPSPVQALAATYVHDQDSSATLGSHISPASVERTTNVVPKTVPRIRIQDIDRNGRRRRVYTKTQFTCSHCPRKFSITNLETYCRHVAENNIQREFKCTEPTCAWSIIGFQRKLERDRHYTRKHGIPEYECRFWAGPGKEIFEGAGVCTTRWHTDAGNRARHERNVHGYYIPTQRGQVSAWDEDHLVKIYKDAEH
ncbi:hypothetical protein V1525DRAFT_349749 [Lipomyces kononenkoae]|uniref:Uncharacterized protein n=1 Tax=Lipomyces kononenkoae TaxID=34357 RepID=A0ACC3SSR1_LIPKO